VSVALLGFQLAQMMAQVKDSQLGRALESKMADLMVQGSWVSE
jgi:hypothetical protein